MVGRQEESLGQLIAKAHAGDREALGRLLSAYLCYLRHLADQRLNPHRHQEFDRSDLVQETLLEAFRDFNHFAGHDELQLKAWLRNVLVHNLLDQAKRISAAKRSWQRERYLEEVGWPNLPIDRISTSDDSTPSAITGRQETENALLEAIEQLPPDYQFVVTLRQFQAITFPQISALMGRSEASVRKIWFRSLNRLAQTLQRIQ